MNSALLLLLLAALASLAAAQDTQGASVDTAKGDAEKTDSNEKYHTVTEDKLDTAAVLLDDTPDNSNRVGDDAGNSTTIAETGSNRAADETTSPLNTTTTESENAPTSVEDPQITVERDGDKQISKVEVDGREYKIVVEPASEAGDSGKRKNETAPATQKTPEDNSASSTVTTSGSTAENSSTVEVTTQESSSEDESSTKSTKATEVEASTQERNTEEESYTKSTNDSTIEVTTQKIGSEEETSIKSINATTVEVTTQKTGSEEETSTKSTISSSEPTKAPASENAVDELPKIHNRRKREAGYAVVDPIITVERDGAKEMHTLDLEGVRYQIVIEPEFVDDPNVDKTQDDGIDNEDLMTMELGMKIRKDDKQTAASGNGTATILKNFPTPGELSTEAPLAAKGGDNITKTTVAA
ncbi:hypothetical protein PRIPAC_96026 [Pristionchus pacificus]|uniref:Uncharacterized protein n=1 Tax=Pristionchus pacificus TaxID=54126 RepID=A0A2A6BCG3_PRIPA|nr:hypothetical protein PRIPAC_96026 [Pristionchus pacificus]|eukprot:PDM63579.1 hypothetical protein PRIPAC_49552 [Pristionchus pacificus]